MIPTPGYYDLYFSSRIFDLPLFGSESPISYHLFASQLLGSGASVTSWLDSGFPNYRTDAGLEISQIRFREGLCRVNAGDFRFSPLQPATFIPFTRESYPMQGGEVRYAGDRKQWSLFAGRPKYFIQLPREPTEEPWLFGARYLAKRSPGWVGVSVIGVENPTYVEPLGGGSKTTGLLAGDLIREISPRSSVFGEVLLTADGGVGARAGAQRQLDYGAVKLTVYSFDSSFPYVYPLYRPGEWGAELSGQFRPSEFSSVSGYLNFYDDTRVEQKKDFRLALGYSKSFGSNRPSIEIGYDRNDVVYDSLSVATSDIVANRFTFSVNKSSSVEMTRLTAEYTTGSEGGQPDRAQVYFLFQRVVGFDSFLTGSAVVHREVGTGFGFTALTTIERPWRGRYYYLVGGGAEYLDDSGRKSGEGVLRLGLSRRVLESGWWARIEAAIPFSVGLSRSGITNRQIAFDFGHKLRWKDIHDLRGVFGSLLARDTGTIEGRVVREGQGVSGLKILVAGVHRDTTGRDGSFRVTRVASGLTTVSLDVRQLEPRLSVVGGPSRSVLVTARETTRVELQLAELSYFQGSVVICDGEQVRPVEGASITIRGDRHEAKAETDYLGGFQFENIPPGVYEVSIDPATLNGGIAPATPLVWRVDLTQDLAGYVIRINCP
ncbi:MAG: hypothetical protein AB1714_23395 [Acidobacteriota bacterium]